MFVLLCVLSLMGCATAQLPSNATPDQKVAAKAEDCAAAQSYLTLISSEYNSPAVQTILIGVDTNAVAQTKAWYGIAMTGAQIAVTAKCGTLPVAAN